MGTSLDDRLQDCTAYLFDLDGVLTPTAEIHKRAWARLFAEFLSHHPHVEPYTDQDYYQRVDGRRRYDGVRGVLEHRHIHLPNGQASDPGSWTSVCGLGNLKDSFFLDEIATHPVRPYPGSLAFLQALIERRIPMAVVSASNNARRVLKSAGLLDFFPVIVDGEVATRHALPGKPAPDTYLAAAHLLSVPAATTAVVEDALGGVTAGRAGGFSPVIGVDRGAGRDALIAAGAAVVVADLADLLGPGQSGNPADEPCEPLKDRTGPRLTIEDESSLEESVGPHLTMKPGNGAAIDSATPPGDPGACPAKED